MRAAALLLLAALAGCATIVPAPPAATSPQLFFERLSALCGGAYVGRVVSADPADREMAASRLVVDVRECSERELRMAFHVGSDRSRVWIVTRTPAGLRLKHIHRHQDGAEDARSRYGGDSAGPGGAARQDFPADAFSRDLFVRESIPESITNVWSLELEPGRRLAYALRRPNRNFRVEFDLTRPVANPPAPWGER
ncbi:MAG TPA: hypothetical protein VLK25_06275 [Allosphingosinicella sp.]|nr:hypothetical protein [Allosphingosinicella sp.]